MDLGGFEISGTILESSSQMTISSDATAYIPFIQAMYPESEQYLSLLQGATNYCLSKRKKDKNPYNLYNFSYLLPVNSKKKIMNPLFIFVILIILFIFLSVFTVKQQSAVIIERFGKYLSVRQSGLHFKIPLIDRIAGRVNLRIQQLDVIIETKTKDNVFVKMKVSVQYKVVQERVYEAFYKLEYPHDQITSYVFDVVRAEVPKLKLDDVFERKDDIAIAVKRELNDAMITYGYDIINTLITDIDPDIQVKNAMNRINAADREKTAAEYEAEAQRIRIVAKAKAEAESKRLQGQGIADQRREIARGLVESVDVLNRVGINSQEASALIVVTQHYDALTAIGSENNSNLILLPNSPQAGSDMLNNMVASFTASHQVTETMKRASKEQNKSQNKPQNRDYRDNLSEDYEDDNFDK